LAELALIARRMATIFNIILKKKEKRKEKKKKENGN